MGTKSNGHPLLTLVSESPTASPEQAWANVEAALETLAERMYMPRQSSRLERQRLTYWHLYAELMGLRAALEAERVLEPER